jgi:hypothetical protein
MNVNVTPELLQSINFDQYKKCTFKISKDCLGISLKENFKGKLCHNCYKEKQSQYQKNKIAKKKLIKLEEKESIKNSQIQKLSEILEPNKLSSVLEILNLSGKNSSKEFKSENIL